MTLVTDTMRRELYCSFCKELYKDPVLLGCDHNFCRACISGVQTGVHRNIKCFECNQVTHTRYFRMNHSLARLVRGYQEAEGDQSLFCLEHGVTANLFCEVEKEAVCLVCRVSENHKDHQHVPITEAVKAHRTVLERSLRAVQREEEEARKTLNKEKDDIRKLKEQKTCLEKKIREEYRKMEQFLDKDRRKLDQELENLEKDYLQRMEEKKKKVSEEISKLQKVISEVEKTLNKSEPEIFKGINTTLTRAEVKFINPERPSVDLCEEGFIELLRYKVWTRMKDSIVP
ncbi:E3 ubiquitin-protein ligase TRIM39-like, partial [Latimeria chalumnae]|uniref:E3 ubiquitin-protein ligase TRIM39-like n=1 Tax=Latimeria chalumnae TaxID=7897 RepID=UPI00313D92C3